MSYILSDHVHTARRKPGRCDQCGRRIELGQRYRRQVHTYDGLQVYRAHEDCDALAQEVRDLNKEGLCWDESINLQDSAPDLDRAWVAQGWPAVAARLWPPGEPEAGPR